MIYGIECHFRKDAPGRTGISYDTGDGYVASFFDITAGEDPESVMRVWLRTKGVIVEATVCLGNERYFLINKQSYKNLINSREIAA